MADEENPFIHKLRRGPDADLRERSTAIAAGEARANFARVLNAARIDRDRVVITDHGDPAAAVVSLRDFRALEYLDSLGLTDKAAEFSLRKASASELIKLLAEARGGGAPQQANSTVEAGRVNTSLQDNETDRVQMQSADKLETAK